MKFNARLILARRMLIITLTAIAFFSLRVAVGQERGQGVRLRIGAAFKSRRGGMPEAITDKDVKPVRRFITAGNEKQTVPDYSYFRRAFVAALDGAADDSRDGFITGVELGEYLHREVSNYTKRAQTPQHGKINNPDLNEGDLVFVAAKFEGMAGCRS